MRWLSLPATLVGLGSSGAAEMTATHQRARPDTCPRARLARTVCTHAWHVASFLVRALRYLLLDWPWVHVYGPAPVIHDAHLPCIHCMMAGSALAVWASEARRASYSVPTCNQTCRQANCGVPDIMHHPLVPQAACAFCVPGLACMSPQGHGLFYCLDRTQTCRSCPPFFKKQGARHDVAGTSGVLRHAKSAPPPLPVQPQSACRGLPTFLCHKPLP